MSNTKDILGIFANKWEIYVIGRPEEVIKNVGTSLRGIVKEVEITSAVHERITFSKIGKDHVE